MSAQARRRPRKPAVGKRMTIINWLTAKNTGDLLVIIIASTVCWMVMGAGMAVVISWIFAPERNTDQLISVISDVINTLVGLLAGFLAGRTDATQTAMKAMEMDKEADRQAALKMAETKAQMTTQRLDPPQ